MKYQIYSLPTCQPCRVLKEKLKEVLAEDEYEILNVMDHKHPTQVIRSVPAMVLNDILFIGPDKILNAIKNDTGKNK